MLERIAGLSDTPARGGLSRDSISEASSDHSAPGRRTSLGSSEVMRVDKGEECAWTSWKGVQTWRKLPSLPIERQFAPPNGFLSLMGWTTAFVSEATIPLVEDGGAFGSRQTERRWARAGELTAAKVGEGL